ncbi:MAG: glycosyltransferase family 4 protein [bacterium]
MITRKVDRQDASPAGFTYTWVKKLGKNLEKLYVITWQESKTDDLPENIKIVSLTGSKWLKIFSIQKKLWKILLEVNGVFCHQNPEYTILTGLLAKIFRKKIVSWYTHKAISWRRYLMEIFADKILTASDKSFRRPLFPKKVEITGHGIDIDYFTPVILKEQKITEESKRKFKILSVGRISPAKDYTTLIAAIWGLVKQGKKDLEVQIIGQPSLKSDQRYFRRIKQLVKKYHLGKYIKFLGPIPHNKILLYYQNCDLFVNLSQTGSIDKTVLEAMSCGRLVLTSNEAFIDVLGERLSFIIRLMFENKNPQDLAQKMINLMNLSKQEKKEIGKELRQKVVKNHNLDNLFKKIIFQFK